MEDQHWHLHSYENLKSDVRGLFKVDLAFFFLNKRSLHQNNKTLFMVDGGNTALTPFTHSHTLRVFALKAVKDGVRPCHSEYRTALYHQISGGRESETS
jgi:hypothetical protein